MLTRGDMVLITFIILFSTAFLYMTLANPDLAGGEAVVTLRGEEIARYPLEDGGQRIEEFQFTVDDRTYTGRLEFDGARVRLHRLSREISPLPIHANMGWISNPNQVIVSVPVQMKVHVEDTAGPSPDEPQIDAVAGSF